MLSIDGNKRRKGEPCFGWPSRGLLDDLAYVADPDLTNNRVTSETTVRKP